MAGRLVATVPPPNGKGILVTNTDVTLDNLEFSGARVADMNGAGVRYQGGNLTITDTTIGRERLQPGHGRARTDGGQGVAAADTPRL
ncbi:hypothetical protein [Siccirubricoccus sp. G192]|uniref:hypothetical protein n=1 Tax=Siccirubricoccus sp. G192 TaxID=2849651 RepID=UPI001C2C317E|nr:hypothetical protein [Siccirubricoccus sp. G192]MBV1798701.1 hypothetical protein [Siccirubricoccus sp. G192]